MEKWKNRIWYELKKADENVHVHHWMGWSLEMPLRWRNFLLKELLKIQLEEFKHD